MSIAVTTRSYSNFRDGANMAESVLTSLAVQKNGIRLLGQIQLPDDARGTEGQPLVVPGLRMEDGAVHEVLFVATMYNDVLAYDTTTLELLWKQHLGTPIVGNKKIDTWQINSNWGILSTPVINLRNATIYVCAMSSPDGLVGDSVFHLHALSLIDGSHLAPPLSLDTATYQAPNLTRVSKFAAVTRKQRCGLLGDFGRRGVDTVFVAAGSFAESADTNQGWLIAVDVTGFHLNVAAALTTTSIYSGSGIWAGGQGPSMDADGFIYCMTGNGSFEPPTDLGESIFKTKYTPKTQGAAASLVVVDWFSPWNDVGRVAGAKYQTLPDTSLLPPNYQQDDPGASNMDGASDSDLGSASPLHLPMSLTGFTKNVIMGSGKDGILYVCDADDMGKTQLGDFAPSKVAANYAKLLSPPYGFSYYPAGVDLMPTDFSTIPTQFGGYTHHVHGTPVAYKSPDHGIMIFVGGENSPVRAFRLNPDFTLTYLGCGAEVASAGMQPPGGMPGSMMTLSANGTVPDTAVLWCLMPLNDDANKRIVQGRLVAYGANWIANGQLVKIWDSLDWGVVFKHSKFNLATCANGKLYVPSYDGRMLIFGLA